MTDLLRLRLPGCARHVLSSDTSQAQDCAPGLFRLPVFSGDVLGLPGPLVCDECGAGGLCPALLDGGSGIIDAAATSEALSALARATLQQDESIPPLADGSSISAGGINAALFLGLDAAPSVVFRATTALRCRCASTHGEYELDQPGQRIYVSRIGLCSLKRPLGCPSCRLAPVDCVMLEDVTEIENLDSAAMALDRESFIGAEDPRAFVHKVFAAAYCWLTTTWICLSSNWYLFCAALSPASLLHNPRHSICMCVAKCVKHLSRS